MDHDSQEELKRILFLAEGELTANDIAFLRARRPYLTKSQIKDYEHLLFPKGNGEQTQSPKGTQGKQNQQPKKQQQQPKDKDTRLNLDQPEGQRAAQPTQTPSNPEEQEEEDECLDPDCTHENHQ